MDQEELAAVVQEIEEEKALGRVSAATVFKGLLNQPELVSLSSANATASGGSYAYSQFNVNMPRPILEAETLQLLAANIPLCTQNIPDTACVFWYYRLDLYANTVPNTENLYYVRLLPSYYKPEFFQPTPSVYGQNITFNDYPSVATQLALSCSRDLVYDNVAATSAEWGGSAVYQVQYFPNDITITYNSTQNKFQMTGLNTAAPLFAWSAPDTYAAGTTYDVGAFVTYNDKVYRSLVSGNIGNTPSTSKTFWAYVTNRLVQDFASYTPYQTGQYAVSGGVIYQATTNIWAASFSTLDGWAAPTQPLGPYNYRYLVTGYGDPNVVINQGTNVTGGNGRQWSPYALFESGDFVQYQGVTYQSSKQVKGFAPFYIPNQTTNAYSASVQYLKGDYVYYSGKWYVNIWIATKPGQPNYTLGNAPTGAYTNNIYWKFIEWSPNTSTVYWKVGDLMTYVGTIGNGVFFYKCIKDNNANQATPISTGGVFNTNPYWIPCYWTPQTSTTNLPTIGLYSLSKTFDMVDTFLGYEQYPFPIAIPPQPINPAPRRLLNSILGFCWNGLFNAAALNTSIGASVDIPNGTTTSEVLNRIRPVPYYTSYGSGGLLTTGNSTTATVFTADGYANLVYSAVISIYTTIVSGTTLDTQRNTNLIGLSSLNAGNLGVSFFDNKIDGKLRINQADIFSIGIELRDEVGELYPLTNNGICSFTLKLTYKDTRETKSS
jgi:hypothetical protein